MNENITLGRMYDDLEHLLNTHGAYSFTKMTVTTNNAFCEAISYRGYYDQVCFEPCGKVTLDKLFEQVKRALSETFCGYKGGEYRYNHDTAVWVNFHGCCEFDGSDELTEHRWLNVLDEAKKSIEEQDPPVEEVVVKKKRKSAAQKRKEEQEAYEKQMAEDWDRAVKEWNVRLMTALQHASSEGIHLQVVGAEFSFPSVDHAVSMFIRDWEDVYALEQLERIIGYARQEREEAERKFQLRQAALAKLTEDDKRILGLNF